MALSFNKDMKLCSVLVYLTVLSTVCHLGGVYGGEFCYYQSYTNLGYNAMSSLYCADGCCGYYYDRSCCTSVGVIAGAVVAILICVGVIGVVIAYLCISNKRKSTKATPVDNVILTPMTSKVKVVPVKDKKLPTPSTADHPAPSLTEPLPGQMTNPAYYQPLSVHQMNIQPLHLTTKSTGYQQMTVLSAKTREPTPTSQQLTGLPAKTREPTPRAHIYDAYDRPPTYYQ